MSGTGEERGRFLQDAEKGRQVTMRPKVSFQRRDIWSRLQACQTVARAYGWHAADIASFSREVSEAFSYEEAMAVILREFDPSPR
jgi:hypothetical protein